MDTTVSEKLFETLADGTKYYTDENTQAVEDYATLLGLKDVSVFRQVTTNGVTEYIAVGEGVMVPPRAQLVTVRNELERISRKQR